LEFYADHAQKLERHLNKYAAMEDFFLTGAMDKVGEGIAERAREAIAQKKSWK
jgi:hypothetical protein